MTISLERDSMPRIVITHAVQDVGRWQDGKAERAAALVMLEPNGLTEVL
jgi:hypothetical protein